MFCGMWHGHYPLSSYRIHKENIYFGTVCVGSKHTVQTMLLKGVSEACAVSILEWNKRAAGSLEMLVPIYQITWHDMPEDCNFNICHCGGNLKSCKKVKSKVNPCTGTEAVYRPYGP